MVILKCEGKVKKYSGKKWDVLRGRFYGPKQRTSSAEEKEGIEKQKDETLERVARLK